SASRRGPRARSRSRPSRATRTAGPSSAAHELVEEAEVVLEEQAQVVDPVPEHRDALGTHPEREALVPLRVQAPVAERDRVDHPGSQDRHPAAAAAGRTADAAADQALDVEGDRGLGERVVAGPEAGPLAGAEHRVGKLVEQATEVAERRALVD